MFVALIKVVIVTKFTTKVVIVTTFATKLVKMPPSVRILESREKKCVERINELKEEALNAGVEEFGFAQVDLSVYLNNIIHHKKEDLDKFLTMADNLPTILDIARQSYSGRKEEA